MNHDNDVSNNGSESEEHTKGKECNQAQNGQEAEEESMPTNEETLQPTSPSNNNVAEDFDSYYLRQVTADFADDIEKLRNAADFKESSVPVLIQALKQGAANFSDEEKRKIMGSGMRKSS